jgi:hypothetical protein
MMDNRATSSGSITANVVDGCLGRPCMSQVICELALLPTIQVEVLPDGKSPPILLGGSGRSRDSRKEVHRG